MIISPHKHLPLLDDHEKESSGMFQFEQLGFVDAVGAVQALYDLSAAELGEMKIHQLVGMVGHVFDCHKNYLQLSKLCREMYVTCHPDCHALRIQHHVRLAKNSQKKEE